MFENGMTWHRADFHLHTKADKEFIYSGSPEDFNGKYVERLLDEGISVGVITNHNKFDRDEYKILKKTAKKKGIWLLPGVELSVKDGANGIHALIVFDKDSWIGGDDDFINQFLTSAFEGVTNRENENTSCRYSLNDTLKKLNEHRLHGRDSFVVLAHVDQDKGFFAELDGGRIANFGKGELFKQSILGFQKSTKFDSIVNCRKWLDGWLPALLQGSDCKSISEVGKPHYINGKEARVYVKIGHYNFEALKYALLDHQHRICKDLPTQNKSFIKSISFSGGKLDGKTISFSSELNSLIGIRGSGKSAIIEILRDALGIELNNAAADMNYKNDLVSYILGSGGKVIIHVHGNDGKDYRLERILNQIPSIYNEDGDRLECSLSAVFETPVYFGQKDLSNKKEAFESELVQRLVGSRIEGNEAIIKEKALNVKNCVLELQKLKDINVRKEELDKAKKDTEQKLLFFEENGVAEKLKVQAQYNKDNKELLGRIAQIKKWHDDLASITSESMEYWQPLIGSKENKELFERANEKLTEIRNKIDDIKEIVDYLGSALQDFDAIARELKIKEESMAESFAKIKRELNSDTINPDTFLNLNNILSDANQKLQEVGKQEELKMKLQGKLNKALDELNEAWRQEFLAIEKEVKTINETNANLSIEVIFKGCRNDFIDHLKQLFKGTGIRETTCQNIGAEFNDYIEIYRDWDKFKKHINDNVIGDVTRRINEALGELLTYKVGIKVSIKFKGKPLSRHSLGQRASALILFLLAKRDTDVLIIDQPEDDLDNQTIYEEVIKEIISLKPQMQFIFATHNANIPVLGDSEKVIACEFEGSNSITLQEGSIDTPSIQKAIVRIMEGGKTAFNRRKEIYNIWKLS